VAAEDLYSLPPSEFTAARDARAKELRKQGDREEADRVKGLRKPTVTAWALNRLARERAKDVKRLLDAGARLRAAQEALLGGADRSKFQRAAAAERELVAELTGEAVALVRDAGEQTGPGLEEKVAETLHAAALDDETAEQLRAGTLVREREAIGGFGTGDASGAAAPPARAKPPGPRKSKADTANRERLSAARTDERHARRELDSAAKARESAEARAEAADVHAREAAERARTTAERLSEAKRAESTARKAHARAARTLEKAERGSARKS
jgi:hypothetical protein